MIESYALRKTYGLMRGLGAAAKYLSRGLFFMMPHSRPSTETVYVKPAPVLHRPETAASVTHNPAPSSAIEPASPPVIRRPADTDLILRGIEFESKPESVRAEIYVRDFDSEQTLVRVKALDEIKRLSEPAAIGILQRLLTTKKDILQLIEILNSLSGLSIEENIDKSIFTGFLRHANPSLRLAAIRAISKYKDEEVFSMLSASLRDRDPEIRRQSLNLLCWTYGNRATTAVLTLLHDADNSVKKTAILICGSLKLKQSISALITLLSDPDKDIQKRASDSLKKITEEEFGFRVKGSDKDKNAAIEDWRFWWRDNQTNFGL